MGKVSEWCLLVALLTTTPARAIQEPPQFAGLNRISLDGAFFGSIKADKGHLLLIDRAPTHHPSPSDTVVSVMDGKGTRVFTRSPGLDISGVWLVNVRDAVLRTPIELVVTANVRRGPQESAFPLRPSDRDASVLLEYDLRTSTLVRVVETTPVQCVRLFGDHDGTLWCPGFDVRKANAEETSFDLVYRFDSGGGLLGSSLSRAGFDAPGPLWGDTRASYASFLPRLGGVRLWLPRVRRLLDLDADGVTQSQGTLPDWPTPDGSHQNYAIGPNGGIISVLPVAETTDSRRVSNQGLFRLDDDTRSWVPLGGGARTLPPDVRFIGVDGASLVFLVPQAHAVYWYPVAEQGTRSGEPQRPW